MDAKKSPCSFAGCVNVATKRGLCHGHYNQARSGQQLSPLRGWTRNAGKTCVFPECGLPARLQGFCYTHYGQRRDGRKMRPRAVRQALWDSECLFDGCDNPARTKGLCNGHYKQLWKGQDLRPLWTVPLPQRCAFSGCDRLAASRGLCSPHYRQRLRGVDLHPIKVRDGKGRASGGYVTVVANGHANARSNNRILEHVKVMSDVLGRPLLRGENVHHKNGVRDDNRPENLELWVTCQPQGKRPEDLVAYAVELLQRYAPDHLK